MIYIADAPRCDKSGARCVDLEVDHTHTATATLRPSIAVRTADASAPHSRCVRKREQRHLCFSLRRRINPQEVLMHWCIRETSSAIGPHSQACLEVCHKSTGDTLPSRNRKSPGSTDHWILAFFRHCAQISTFIVLECSTNERCSRAAGL
jgi:hypothetical protein